MKYIKVNDNELLKIGDAIQLADRLGEQYKATHFFDSSVNCTDWDIVIPSSKSFKSINFFHGNNIFGHSTAMYSGMLSNVVEIIHFQSNIFFIYRAF